MHLTISRKGDTAFVAVAGELDLASGRDLDAAVRQAVDDGARAVQLDLTDCSFIDSSGLAVLLRWREEAQSAGWRFEVTGARGVVRRVFRMTGVLDG